MSSIQSEPDETGSDFQDAYLAAVADYLSIQYLFVDPPLWTSSSSRILPEPGFPTSVKTDSMKEWCVFSSPAEFIMHNIFTEPQPLRRKNSHDPSFLRDRATGTRSSL